MSMRTINLEHGAKVGDIINVYSTFSDPMGTVATKHLWPVEVLEDKIILPTVNGNVSYNMRVRFINPNMFGFHTERICSRNIVNSLTLKDIYMPILCGYGCIGNAPSMDEHGNKSLEYSKWAAMISRCYNPKDSSYRSYGARGVYVCHRWLCYEFYLQDLPLLPGYNEYIAHGMTGYDIDKDTRYPGNLVYSADTCCFIPSQYNYSTVAPKPKSGYFGVVERVRNDGTLMYDCSVNHIHYGTFDCPEAAACLNDWIIEGMDIKYANLDRRNNIYPRMSIYEINSHKINGPDKYNGRSMIKPFTKMAPEYPNGYFYSETGNPYTNNR